MQLDSAKQVASAVFSNTYLEARQKFLAAAPTSRAYPCSLSGPAGEALFTDAAYYGPADAKNLLVLVSATHGVEGYCGSAGQLVFLQAGLQEQLPPSTAVLFVHALNCYGFAWDRRTTAEGVDLNRNFVDFAEPLPENPGYEELAEYIVPANVSQEGVRRAQATLDEYRAKHGEANYQRARTSGQYTRPGGLCYGGSEPTEARRTLERIAADFDATARDKVIIIDYHSGLGPYGYGELQCEQPSGLDGYERAAKIFGPSVTSPELGTSTGAIIPGTQDAFWERALGDRHIYVCLEFGTYTRGPVFRGEQWLFTHRPEEADSEIGREIRRDSKEYFYPQIPDWQEMIAWRCHQVHRQALAGLASEA